MSEYETARKTASVTRLPDSEVARLLVGAPWRGVEVPGGRLIHSSKSNPGAWSAASLLVRGDTDVLVYAESYDVRGEEHFCLRFACSTDDWCRSHLQFVRPAYSQILKWPPTLECPADFMRTGPTTAEMGLGDVLQITQSENQSSPVPVLWYFLHAGKTGLLLFADNEIPLNIGICDTQAASIVKKSFQTRSVVTV